MMFKTHLTITLFFILLLLGSISNNINKFIFFFFTLISSILPDIDIRYSIIGKNKMARPIQFFTKHRDFIHSFTFCLLVTIILIFIFPILALSFFVGYSIHLLIDSFTPEGIKFFWPSKIKSSWKIRTGSLIDKSLFFIFLFFDILIVIFKIIILFN
ncbi:MAG: metal-dependent hydrolase [Candidatus Pacearchaeota archaeon]